MSEGEYIPEENVYQNVETGEVVPKDAEGKVTKVASKGVPMPMARARELGLVGDEESGEAEAKATDAPPENKAMAAPETKRTQKAAAKKK